MLIEVIVQNHDEAIKAEKLGADRLELVSAITEGGLTPSYGTIKQVLSKVTIPVQVMIRPHSYHYLYSKADSEIILEDIKKILDLGGNRIVFGALNQDNTVDEETLSKLVSLSSRLDITFHRAFDEVPSQTDAYATLLKYKKNVKRVLTSGGKSNCETGKYQLSELVKLAEQTNGPEIMPGSGLTPSNFESVHQIVNARQYHFGTAMRKEQSFANEFDEQAFVKLRQF
ncbi:copper homeostasis protein CutC [Aquibacillus saliphilus]|uniref:copper homeostasis protein CutC n=1 Tax=Aquibacillus saliphilus TaxID=1909422 RepID=UPI001CF06628|nr:copper homeostasis protein CutC [Aquibacillus saliphilus]